MIKFNPLRDCYNSYLYVFEKISMDRILGICYDKFKYKNLIPYNLSKLSYFICFYFKAA